MNTKIKFLGLAVIGLLLIGTSCNKEEEKIEESLGTEFTVEASGGDSWDVTSVTAKTEGSAFVIKATKDNKEVVLTIKEFAKGKYHFNDASNFATYSSNKTDAAKLYSSTNSGDNFIEILNIHSDGVRFDGSYSFLATDENNDVQTINGAWINVSKQ